MCKEMHFIIDWTNVNEFRDLFEYLGEEGAYIEVVECPPEIDYVKNVKSGEMEKIEYSGCLLFELQRRADIMGLESDPCYITGGSITYEQTEVNEEAGVAFPDWIEWEDEMESEE